MRKRLEQGQATLVFALGLIVLMWLLIGLMDDLGRLALAEVRAHDAAELAVQDAANSIDPNAFFGGQAVRLSARATWQAQAVADRLTGGRARSGGRVSLGGVMFAGGGRVLLASAEVEVPLRWMARVGVPVGRRAFQVAAMPAYGLQVEND